MVKKLLGSFAFFLIAATAFAQTIVSTTPENKKVILEEFTGIYCQFCPDGHAIAQGIVSSYPGEVFVINIHTGGFANPTGNDPDFRTPYGAAIAGQSGLIGYPAGTVNRHYFPGQSQSGGQDTAMSRGQWGSASVETLGEASYLNMAVEAEVDVVNSEIVVHVEAYYTGDSPEANNFLNVALLQNNTLGPQTGGNMGNEYPHQHRLVELITGQWGESISPTTTGTFIDRTYTYPVPANYNNVPVVLEDLEVVVFMTETTQEIISGNGAYPTFVNLPNQDDASVEFTSEANDQCGIDYIPEVTIQNRGNNVLTSLDIDYSINGGATQTYTWSGSLGGYETERVSLDPIPYTLEANNTVDVSIPNDDDNSNNNTSTTFGESDETSTQQVRLLMNTGNSGSGISWTLRDANGVVAQGDSYGNNETVDQTINLPEIGCHEFKLYSDLGGAGSVAFFDSDNNVLLQSSGDFGGELSVSFTTNGVFGLTDNNLNNVVLFPNPAKNSITITNAENANIVIYDILGKVVASQTGISNAQQIAITNLQAGTYFVKIEIDQQTSVERFIVSK